MAAAKTVLPPLMVLILAGCAGSPATERSGAPTDFYAGLSDQGRSVAEIALQTALEKNVSGEQEAWKTGDDSFGYLTPIETWESETGHWCRRFSETLRASGEARDRQGVACRVDGRWRMTEA